MIDVINFVIYLVGFCTVLGWIFDGTMRAAQACRRAAVRLAARWGRS